jgi:hypothetical protein
LNPEPLESFIIMLYQLSYIPLLMLHSLQFVLKV